jgi:RNA polymerase sigma-70 factor (ECF subfamily)
VNREALWRNKQAMDDDELIAAVAAGDDVALRELFSRHAPWLAARLRTALPPADVEDALQETFLAVWRGAAGYRPAGVAGGWLWGIARRQAAGR